MDGRPKAGTGGRAVTAGSDVTAMADALRRRAADLGEIRRHALAVTLLSWESPAGRNFRSYLFERCLELSRTIDLLESAAVDLGEYGRLIRDAEMLRHQAGQ
ncbi:hypothetical protein MN0502_31640 [Arthrobacter sp. MN05-02]|nr:hypothetical protein MN0502_31640 [Arthrobacter sp. MN05-02]